MKYLIIFLKIGIIEMFRREINLQFIFRLVHNCLIQFNIY